MTGAISLLRALVANVVLTTLTAAPSLCYGVAAGPVLNQRCEQEVLYGRLLALEPAAGTFRIEGYGAVLKAPSDVDVTALDGTLVRIDFDALCRVRSVLPAERLEGPMIEAGSPRSGRDGRQASM